MATVKVSSWSLTFNSLLWAIVTVASVYGYFHHVLPTATLVNALKQR